MDRAKELSEVALDWMQTSVLRVIVTRVVPLVMGSSIVTAVLAWLQNAVGLNLPTPVVTAWVVTVMGGVIATAFAYVKNHGAGAAIVGKAALELETIYEAGREVERANVNKKAVDPPAPSVPPGLES
jgi:hypothetical protein